MQAFITSILNTCDEPLITTSYSFIAAASVPVSFRSITFVSILGEFTCSFLMRKASSLMSTSNTFSTSGVSIRSYMADSACLPAPPVITAFIIGLPPFHQSAFPLYLCDFRNSLIYYAAGRRIFPFSQSKR